MKKIVLLISLISLLFISCENTLSKIENPSVADNSTNTPTVTTTPSDDGKTYITFGDISFENEARTINPVYNRDHLTAIYIKGLETSKVTPSTSSNDYTTLFGLYSSNPKATSYADLCTKTFEITPGIWNFILYATLYDFEFAGTTTVEIKPGMTHTLNFTLATTNTSSYPYGVIDITVDFTGNADRVVATLKEKSTSPTAKLTKTYTPTDTTNPISTVEGENFRRINFKTNKSSSSGVTTGKYYLLFEFFKDGIEAPVNTVENIVRVENNFTTKTTLNLDLDDLYTITYGFYEGSGEFFESELKNLTFAPAGTVLPSVYSKKSPTFTLPTPSLPGYTFDAWYKNSDFTESNKITEITQGSTGNLELYANFIEGGSGDGTEDFSSIQTGTIIYSSSIAPTVENYKDNNNLLIPKMYVCNHLVTQSEYEKYMTYYGVAVTGTEEGQADSSTPYKPSSTDDKNTTPAYYVSWIEAIIYCNLRSMDEGLIPVYSRSNITDPSVWAGWDDSTVVISNGKYYYNSTSGDYGYDTDSSFKINQAANGYRLATSAEYMYIVDKETNLTGISGKDEWTQTFTYEEAERCYFSGDIATSGTVTGKVNNAYRGSDMGFRVVRYQLNVGDVLTTYGQIIPYQTSNQTYSDEMKGEAIGVIYDVDEKGAPRGVVGLKNSGETAYNWAESGTTGNDTNFSAIVCTPSDYYTADTALTATFTGVTDGSNNWNLICESDDTAEANPSNYPAFTYANTYTHSNIHATSSYKDGWYIPSIAELCYLFRNRGTLNSVLNDLGGTQLQDAVYWSSSQDEDHASQAWTVDMSNSKIYAYMKYGSMQNNRVCCVHKL